MRNFGRPNQFYGAKICSHSFLAIPGCEMNGNGDGMERGKERRQRQNEFIHSPLIAHFPAIALLCGVPPSHLGQQN